MGSGDGETDSEMSTDERIRLLIDALNNSERELNQLKRDLGEVETRSRRASGGLDQLDRSGQALKAGLQMLLAGGISRALWGLSEMSALENRASRTLDEISGSSVAAAANLAAMERATLGAATQAEMMDHATTLLALGLARDARELERVTQLVTTLGSRFGGTLQSFQLMMSNQSLQRIDEFGLSIEEVTRRYEAYTRAGKDAEEAFRLAVLDAMQEKFEALGGAVVDDALVFDQLRAAAKDFATEMGQTVLPTVATLAGNTAEWLRISRQAVEEFGLWGVVADIIVEAVDVFDIIPTQLDEIIERNRLVTMGLDAIGQGYSDVGVSMSMVVPQITQTTTETESLTRATVNYRDELNRVNMLMRDDWTRAQERYRQSIRAIDADLAETQAQLAEYQALHGQVMDTERDRAEILRELTFVEERARIAQERLNLAASDAPELNLDALRASAREASSELRSIESQLKSMQAGTFYGPDDYLRYLQDVFRYEQLLDQQAEALERQAEAEAALAPAEETYAAAQAREAEIRAQEQQLRLEEQLYGLQKQREALLDELNNPQRYDYTEEISTMEQRERELHERRLQAIEERVTAERQAALKILEARILEGGVTPGEVEVYRAMAERYGMLDPATMSLIRQADQLLGRGFQRAPFLPSAGGPQMTPAPAPTGSTLNLYGDLVVQGSNVGDILSQVQRMVP